MMIKLYKSNSQSIEYWETWNSLFRVVIHWGILGEEGKARNIWCWSNFGPIIEREAQLMRRKGFSDIPLEKHEQIIVQYRIEGMGSPTDLSKRRRVQNLLNECLGWTGNGHCDGGDIGSGSINIYSFVVDPTAAVKTIVQDLKKHQLSEGAIIALQKNDKYEVLWPTNFKGAFRLLYS